MQKTKYDPRHAKHNLPQVYFDFAEYISGLFDNKPKLTPGSYHTCKHSGARIISHEGNQLKIQISGASFSQHVWITFDPNYKDTDIERMKKAIEQYKF